MYYITPLVGVCNQAQLYVQRKSYEYSHQVRRQAINILKYIHLLSEYRTDKFDCPLRREEILFSEVWGF